MWGQFYIFQFEINHTLLLIFPDISSTPFYLRIPWNNNVVLLFNLKYEWKNNVFNELARCLSRPCDVCRELLPSRLRWAWCHSYRQFCLASLATRMRSHFSGLPMKHSCPQSRNFVEETSSSNWDKLPINIFPVTSSVISREFSHSEGKLQHFKPVPVARGLRVGIDRLNAETVGSNTA